MDTLKTIAKSEKSWRLGEKPWRLNDKTLWALIPIFHDVIAEKPDYLLTQQAKDKLVVPDSGSINQVIVKNDGELPILFRIGEMIEGKTQTRMTLQSDIIKAGQQKNIETRCAYQSKGIRSGAMFEKFGTYAPQEIIHMAMSSKARTGQSVSQSTVWTEVAEFSNVAKKEVLIACQEISGIFNSSILRSIERKPIDDLAGNIEEVEKLLNQLFKEMPSAPTQTGLALVGLKGCFYIEFFDLPEPWQISRDAILASEAELIAKYDNTGAFEFKPEKALEQVKTVLNLDYEEKIQSQDGYQIIQLRKDDYVGEVVEFNGKTIHCVITKSIR
jgi:hypothetical protein